MDKSEALFLAQELEAPLGTVISGEVDRRAAAELRRLHAVNQELLEALKAMLTHMGMDEDDWNKPTFDQARAAIAKAEGKT